jgi:hypothetical protein
LNFSARGFEPLAAKSVTHSVIKTPHINGFNGENGAAVNQALTRCTPRNSFWLLLCARRSGQITNRSIGVSLNQALITYTRPATLSHPLKTPRINRENCENV